MFYRIVLGAVRRVVRNTNFQFKTISKALKSLLENVPIGGVAAATIAKDQDSFRIWILVLAVLKPPMGNAIATKVARVVTHVEVQVSFVSGQIKNPVGNHLAFAGTWEIVVQCLHSLLSKGLTIAGKISHKLFFLCVDADYRVSGIQI